MNNWREIELTWLREAWRDHQETIKYMVWGQEIGKEEGTPHLQGYVRLKKRMRRDQVMDLLGCDRLHVEVAEKCFKANETYCKKEGNWEEHGEPCETKRKRERNDVDFELVVDRVRSGKTMQEVAEEFPEVAMRFSTGLKFIFDLFKESAAPTFMFGPYKFYLSDQWRHDVRWDRSLWIWGKSGIGKTQWALTLLERPLLVTHIDQLRLFDSRYYGGIVFDDMSFLHFPRTGQIHLLDCSQPRALHVRYGTVNIPAYTKKIFTSNDDIFLLDDPAIKRRVHRHCLMDFEGSQFNC